MSANEIQPYRRIWVGRTIGGVVLVLFLYLIYQVIWGGLGQGGGRKVEAVFAESLNITPGAAEVRVRGLAVGQVDSVEITEDGYILATMRIDEDVDLRADARASLRLKTLLGEKYIDLTPGEAAESFPGRIELTHTNTTADLTKMMSGNPDSFDAFEILGKPEMLYSGLDDVAAISPEAADLSVEVFHRFREMTDALVLNKEVLLGAIDSTAALTGTVPVIASIFNQLGALSPGAMELFARADTAVQVLMSIANDNMDGIMFSLGRMQVVLDSGMESLELFGAGAQIPLGLWGFGPLAEMDLRQEGPNAFPPYPTRPYTKHEVDLPGGEG